MPALSEVCANRYCSPDGQVSWVCRHQLPAGNGRPRPPVIFRLIPCGFRDEASDKMDASNQQDAKRILETALLCAHQPLTVREMRALFADLERPPPWAGSGYLDDLAEAIIRHESISAKAAMVIFCRGYSSSSRRPAPITGGLSGIWVWRGCLSSKSIQSRRGALRKQSDDWQRLIASTPECWRAWALCLT